MVLKMDEEDNSDTSRSPPPPKVRKDESSGEKDNPKMDKSSGNNTSGGRQQTNESVPSKSSIETKPVSSLPGTSAGKPRYSNNTFTSSNSVMQSYDQSLSPASQLSASHESPKSVPAPNLPQLVKPEGKPGENSSAPADLVSTSHFGETIPRAWKTMLGSPKQNGSF